MLLLASDGGGIGIMWTPFWIFPRKDCVEGREGEVVKWMKLSVFLFLPPTNFHFLPSRDPYLYPTFPANNLLTTYQLTYSLAYHLPTSTMSSITIATLPRMTREVLSSLLLNAPSKLAIIDVRDSGTSSKATNQPGRKEN